MNPEVIVTNIKKRFTGVSGTVNALLPVQARTLPIAYLGSDMPGAVLAAQQSSERFVRLSFWQAQHIAQENSEHHFGVTPHMPDALAAVRQPLG